MADPLAMLVPAAAALLALVVIATAALKGWRDWIALQRLRIEGAGAPPSPAGPAARIELADLRERVRKLEAIAAGVEF